MKRVLLGLVSLSLVASSPSFVTPAWAHGGQYRGPAGEVPPDSRQPHDPPPPETPPGTPTPPGGGGGDTPTPPGNGDGDTPTPPGNGEAPDPSGPAPAPVPQPGNGSKPGTPSGRPSARKAVSYESWLFWWNYNKDEILNLRRSLRGGRGSTAVSLATVATGGSAEETAPQDITARAVESRIVPILRTYAEDGTVNFDIQSAAVLGLAKIGRREFAGLMMKMAENNGAEQYHKVVEESAALALGILQDRSPAVRDFLRDLASNGSARVRTRAFAAFSLGLLGGGSGDAAADARTLDTLRSLVLGREASEDIADSALVAMGLLGDPAAIPDLVRWLNEEKAGGRPLSDLTLSCAAGALGRIGRPGFDGADSREVLDALRDQLRRKNRMTRYSAIIALGQIGPRGEPKVQTECVDTLLQVIRSEGRSGFDTQSVNFALVALGRIGGAPADAAGRPGCAPEARQKALGQLLATFQDKGQSRSFAALGIGLLGRSMDPAQRDGLAEPIRKVLPRMSGDFETRGALVLSLGLLGDLRSVETLETLLNDRGLDRRLRGNAAVALGLIGEQGALEGIRAALAEKSDRDLRVDAATAAGLLGDSTAVPVLVETLKDPKSSQFVLGSVATALGRIGDERALDPLASILGNKDYPDLTRALAAVALGQIGDRSDIPVLSRVSTDVNYRAFFDAIGELLTII